jgi:hypothetical protein
MKEMKEARMFEHENETLLEFESKMEPSKIFSRNRTWEY